MHFLSGKIPQTDLSVGVLAVLYQSSWYLLELATRGPPRPAAEPAAEPAAGKCPAPGSRDYPDRAKGQFGSKNDEKVKVLRMEFSIVRSLSGLQESIFSLFRDPQLNSR